MEGKPITNPVLVVVRSREGVRIEDHRTIPPGIVIGAPKQGPALSEAIERVSADHVTHMRIVIDAEGTQHTEVIIRND